MCPSDSDVPVRYIHLRHWGWAALQEEFGCDGGK